MIDPVCVGRANRPCWKVCGVRSGPAASTPAKNVDGLGKMTALLSLAGGAVPLNHW